MTLSSCLRWGWISLTYDVSANDLKCNHIRMVPQEFSTQRVSMDSNAPVARAMPMARVKTMEKESTRVLGINKALFAMWKRYIHMQRHANIYRKTSNIRRTLLGKKIVAHSDVVGASPVGAAPTTSSFSTQYLASIDWTKTTARRDNKHLELGIWCVLY